MQKLPEHQIQTMLLIIGIIFSKQYSMDILSFCYRILLFKSTYHKFYIFAPTLLKSKQKAVPQSSPDPFRIFPFMNYVVGQIKLQHYDLLQYCSNQVFLPDCSNFWQQHIAPREPLSWGFQKVASSQCEGLLFPLLKTMPQKDDEQLHSKGL